MSNNYTMFFCSWSTITQNRRDLIKLFKSKMFFVNLVNISVMMLAHGFDCNNFHCLFQIHYVLTSISKVIMKKRTYRECMVL
jgi:hypothetical protein